MVSSINQTIYLQSFAVNPLLSFAVCSLSAFKMNQIFIKQMHLLNLSRKKTQIAKKVFFCVMQLNAAAFSLMYPTASALVLIAGYITALAISHYLPKPTSPSQPCIEEQSLSNEIVLNKILTQEDWDKKDCKARFKILAQIAKSNPVLYAVAQKNQVRIINEHPQISTLSFFDSFEEMILFAKTQGLDRLNLATVSDKQIEEVVHHLPGLKELNMSFCKDLSTNGVKAIAHLTNLTNLQISSCRGVNNESLQAIATLTNLTHLNLSGCGIDNTGLQALALNLTKLRHLNLSTCEIEIFSLQAVVPHLTNLTHLEIRACKNLDDLDLETIALHLKKLIFLDISASQTITTVGIQSLAYLTTLTSLKMGLCSGLDEVSLQTISSNLTELTHLDISLCNTAGIQAIANLKNLTDLQMSNCPKLDDTSLQAITSNLKKLTKLNISCPSPTITTIGIQSLAKLTNLTNLQVYGCRGIDDASLQIIASHLTKLTELNIFGSNATTAGIKALALLKNLTHLNMYECRGVDDSSLHTIASSLQNLTELTISECRNVTSTGVQELRLLKNLHCLSMENCDGVDDFSLTTIMPHLPKLTQLNLNNCRHVSATGIQTIAPYCSNLSSLYLRDCRLDKKAVELILPKKIFI